MLAEQARDHVLENIRKIVRNRWSQLVAELQSFAAARPRPDVTLSAFVHEQGVPLGEIYRDGGSELRTGWTALRRDAGLLPRDAPAGELELGRRFASFLTVDDEARLGMLRRLSRGLVDPSALRDKEARLLQMAFYATDSERRPAPGSLLVSRLAEHPVLRDELGELVRCLESGHIVKPRPVPGAKDTPLCLHAAYRLWELLPAMGYWSATRRPEFQSGVLGMDDRNTELILVTLDKGKGFHESVAYHDYAISPERFHWQSQNTAGPDTRSGNRYIRSAEMGWTIQLFVRTDRGSPYRACGPVRLVSAEGAKPMSIVWELEVPLPPRLYERYSVLRHG